MEYLIFGEIAAVIGSVLAAVTDSLVARAYPRAAALEAELPRSLLTGTVMGIDLTLAGVGCGIWGIVSRDWGFALTCLVVALGFGLATVWAFAPVRRAERTGSPSRGGRDASSWWWWS